MARHFAPSDERLLRRLLSDAGTATVALVVVRGGGGRGGRRRLDGDGKDGGQGRGGDVQRRREGFTAGEAEEEQLQGVGVVQRDAAAFHRFRTELFVRRRLQHVRNLKGSRVRVLRVRVLRVRACERERERACMHAVDVCME